MRACLQYNGGNVEWKECPMVEGKPQPEILTPHVLFYRDDEPVFGEKRFTFHSVKELHQHTYALYKES
jgi:hypothetical protein